jgi:hypothetical protein
MVELELETQEFLRTVAETLLAHRKWYELQSKDDLELDDDGLYQLSEAYLILYALYTKGDIPRNGRGLN